MINRQISASLAASSLLLAALGAAPVASFAQDTTYKAGTSGTATGKDVSASTYGSGTTTRSPDGTSMGVSGGGEAKAVNGTAATDASAKVGDRRAMQRATATAQDEDEKALARSRTMVREGKDVRSRTTTRYKAEGAPPVRTSTYTVTNPDGTTTTRTK